MRNSCQNWCFCCPTWPWNMTNQVWIDNRVPLLYCLKLCALFQSHLRIQTGVTVRKRSIWVKISVFSRVIWKFDGWPWKTIVYLFYTTTSFVYYFKGIGEFKLKLQSRNTQLGSKPSIFGPIRPWNLTDNLEKQRAPLLCYSKLCASFHNHQWFGVIVRKRPIWVKIGDFFCPVSPWN